MTDDPALADYLGRRAEHGLRAREAAQRQVQRDDDPAMIVSHEIEFLRLPVEVIIDYIDANGQQTLRNIQIRKFDGYYLGAYCLLRRAYRSFVADRVREAFDTDGVAIVDFPGFLDIHYGADSLLSEARLRQKYWRSVGNIAAPELLLLRIVAASDGHLSPAESAIISDHALTLMARKDVPGERDALLRYVSRLSGTRETVIHALDFMTRQSRLRRKRFGETCLTLVQADGHVDDAEINMLRVIETSGAFA